VNVSETHPPTGTAPLVTDRLLPQMEGAAQEEEQLAPTVPVAALPDSFALLANAVASMAGVAPLLTTAEPPLHRAMGAAQGGAQALTELAAAPPDLSAPPASAVVSMDGAEPLLNTADSCTGWVFGGVRRLRLERVTVALARRMQLG
jgi:hypothetical protein